MPDPCMTSVERLEGAGPSGSPCDPGARDCVARKSVCAETGFTRHWLLCHGEGAEAGRLVDPAERPFPPRATRWHEVAAARHAAYLHFLRTRSTLHYNVAQREE